MASPLINTRKDLDSLAGTPEHAAFIALLRGSIYTLSRDELLKTWVAKADATAIGRFGFTLADFPDAKPPALPVYTEPSADEVAAAARKELDEQEWLQAKADSIILALVNAAPAQFVTYARTNFPSLTLAEQNKMGVILNILAVAVRGVLR